MGQFKTDRQRDEAPFKSYRFNPKRRERRFIIYLFIYLFREFIYLENLFRELFYLFKSFFFFFLFIYLGDVLLPIDTSSRVLELAYKLDFHWYFISSSSLPHLFLISSLSLVYFFFISCSWPF